MERSFPGGIQSRHARTPFAGSIWWNRIDRIAHWDDEWSSRSHCGFKAILLAHFVISRKSTLGTEKFRDWNSPGKQTRKTRLRRTALCRNEREEKKITTKVRLPAWRADANWISSATSGRNSPSTIDNVTRGTSRGDFLEVINPYTSDNSANEDLVTDSDWWRRCYIG